MVGSWKPPEVCEPAVILFSPKKGWSFLSRIYRCEAIGIALQVLARSFVMLFSFVPEFSTEDTFQPLGRTVRCLD
jgi:hypothetical protein